MIELTPSESKAAVKCPEILRHVADWHDCQATMADAIGEFDNCVEFHKVRAKVLRDEANKLEGEI